MIDIKCLFGYAVVGAKSGMGTFTAPQPEALSGTFKITKTPEGWAVTVDNKTTDFPNLPELHNFVTATLVAKRMEKK